MSPLDHLAYPDDGEIVPDLAQLILGGMGTILSPTAIVRTLMDQVFDFDPVTEVFKHASGDWNGVAQMSRAYNNLADYVDECAASLDSAVGVAMEEWSGLAAAAAETYALEQLKPALSKLAGELRSIAGQCQSVSVGMHQTAELLNDGFNLVCDSLLLLAIEAAATAATSWTVVGGIVGGVAMAATIAKIAADVRRIGTYFSYAQGLLDGTSGLVPGFLGALEGFGNVPIPRLAIT